jgi:DNA invertase Pin-like site-specific DNA recombinase
MNVLLAARLSRKGGKQEGLGIETQDARMLAWAEQQGHTVAGVAGDYSRGTVAPWDRPHLKPWVTQPDQMARYEAIIAYKHDRLSRGPWADEARIRMWAEEHGKKLIIVDGPQWPPRHDGDKWSWEAAATQSRKEWEEIRERSMRAQAALREKDKHVGRAAFGWTITGDKYDKQLAVFEPEAEITREMVRRYLDGESLAEICQDFDRRDITTRSGAKWNAKTMGQYLKRPVLYGSRTGTHGVQHVEGIIDFDEWQAVQKRLKARAHKTGGKVPSEYALLSGVLYCEEGHKLYRFNTGYYCRTCPTNERVLIPQDRAEAEVIKWVSQLTEPEIQTVVEHGTNHREEIDRLSADISSLDPRSPDYLTQVTEMGSEIQRLQALPTEPDSVREIRTGRTIGEAFLMQPTAGQRAFLIKNVRASIGTQKTPRFDGWLLNLGVREEKMMVQVLVPRKLETEGGDLAVAPRLAES